MNGALQDCLSSLESWSTIIRNFGLVAAAVFALWFARKRILVADRQADTAQRGLLNERCQKGAEMLGSKVLASGSAASTPLRVWPVMTILETITRRL